MRTQARRDYEARWRAGRTEEQKIARRTDARSRWEVATANKYGYTLEEWRAKKTAQPCCAICHCELSDAVAFERQKKRNTRHADHNHDTGQFREFLCSFCNLVIGYSEESISILENAIAYVRRHTS